MFRELPFHGVNLYDLFSSCLVGGPPWKKYLSKLSSVHDLDLFSLNVNPNMNSDYLDFNQQKRSQYYLPHSFSQFKNKLSGSIIDTGFSLLHRNVRNLKRNLENLQVQLLEEINYHFSVIGITETRIKMLILLILFPKYQIIG